MKKEIHPEVMETNVICSCGNTFKVTSNTESLSIEVCNKCHPFFTGKQGQTKKTGNVEKFNKKYNIKEEK